MSQQNFFVCGPKFTKVFSPNVERVVADQVFLRCWICRSVPEIFAIKVESCQKSGRNLDVLLALPNFWGAGLPKVVCAYARYHPCVGARRLEKFREDTPTSPEVIEAHTLDFRPDF